MDHPFCGFPGCCNQGYNHPMPKNRIAAVPPLSESSATLPNLEVRVVIFGLRKEQLHVLLTSCQQHDQPPATHDCFELPGSAILAQRSLEETATVTMLRLTRLREAYLEQLYTYGDTARKPGERMVSVVYFAIFPARAQEIVPTRENHWATWFALQQLPALAGDTGEIITYALRRLRYKLEYTAVGFQLLPEQFTLSELQNMYELILGEQLDKRNFRRRMLQAGIIEQTEEKRGGEGRPARLYRYRPDAVAEVKARRLFP